MNRKFLTKTFSALSTTLVFTATTVWAGNSPDLEQQVQELIQQNQMLTERLQQVEQQLEGGLYKAERKSHMHRLVQQEIQAQLAEDEGLLQKINKRVSLSGLVEVEASAGKSFDGTDSSDITLATVELGLDAEIFEWASAHLLLLWEENDTEPVDLDEGTITFGNIEKFPAYLTAGKMYMPFGLYDTYMIQDTLTHDLGEVGDTALLVGLETGGFYASLYAFNGDVDEVGEDDAIKSFGASVGYGFENDKISLDVGLGLINNLSESDVIRGIAGFSTVDNFVGGLATYLSYRYGPFSVMAEYVGATDAFQLSELAFNGHGADPEAWNFEIAYLHELMGKETSFALGYQGTNEALALEMPESRYLMGVSSAITDNTSLSLEYFHDKDYNLSEGGSDNDADQLTMLFAFEF